MFWRKEGNNVKLYVAVLQTEVPKTLTFSLIEHQVQSKPISDNNTLVLQVPASTVAMSLFVQSGRAGKDTRTPPTKFRCTDSSERNLSSLQITYANSTKPSTPWISRFGNQDNRMSHRYLESMEECGLSVHDGGAESIDDWLKRGPIMHYTFNRDKDDMSTNCEIQMNFSSIEPDAKLFIISHYRRTSRVTSENGVIVSIEKVDR